MRLGQTRLGLSTALAVALWAWVTVSTAHATRSLVIGEHAAMPAGAVQVPVTMTDAAGVAAVSFIVNFDPDLLALSKVTTGGLGAAFTLEYKLEEGRVIVALVRDEALASGAGTLAYLDFAVNAGAVAGMTSPLAIADGTASGQHAVDLAWSQSVGHSNGVVRVVSLPPQAITFGPLSPRAYGSGSFALSATASSGLPVSYVSSDLGVVTISGSNVTLVGAGTATITASQAGDGVYGAANNVSQLLTVNPGAATVTLDNLSQTYDGTARSVTATTVPASLTVGFTYGGSATAPTAAGSYIVVGTVTDANCQGSATNTLVIGKATATVTLGSLSQTYDGSAKPVSVVTSPLNLAVSVTYNGNSSVPTNAGSYSVIGVVTDANYRATNSASGQITRKALSVTAPVIAAKAYDVTAMAGAVSVGTLAGFVGNEIVVATGAAAAYASANVGTYPGVIITYTLYDGTGGGLAANYSLADGTADGQITSKALSVAGILASDKVYDGTTNATLILTHVALAGNLDGTNVVLSTTNATGAFADPNAGIDKTVQVSGLTLSGSATSNYLLTQPTTNATITGKPLNLTANGDSKTYGEVKTYGPGRTAFSAGAGELVSGDSVTSVALA